MSYPILPRLVPLLTVAVIYSWQGCRGGAVAKTAAARDDGAEYVTHARALTVADLGSRYAPGPARVPEGLAYPGPSDMGGSTSVRRLRGEDLNFKRQGYYVRNRELGQVFTVPSDLPAGTRVDAVVLRTGNSSSAVRAGAAGAPLQVHWFAVDGSPRIDDNGTPAGAASTHGYTDNHRADDLVTGVTYRPLMTAEGGVFPVGLPATDANGGQPGHLRYLRFDLLGDGELELAPGRRYAFLVGFGEPGPDRGFTLANNNLAAVPDGPALRRDTEGGARWGIRREGDGTTPPTMRPGAVPAPGSPPDDSLRSESLYPADYLTEVPPTSDGYPDVDTYRALEFYIEVTSP